MLGRNAVPSVVPKTQNSSQVNNMVLPKGAELKGGVLVFFPSYASMESVAERWKATGLYDQLKATMGNVLMEPKGSINTAATVVSSAAPTNRSFMAHTTSSAESAAGSEANDSMKGIVGQFDAIILKHNVCLLLAVCRSFFHEVFIIEILFTLCRRLGEKFLKVLISVTTKVA